jgi:hypothetical protein
MNLAEASKIIERITRLSKKSQEIKGDGSTWSYVFPNGVETTYIVNGLKSQEEMEDDISNVFIWLWSFKDYLKSIAKQQKGDGQYIENLVNNDQKLSICADIANRLKHGSLNKSRSGKFPSLGNFSYTAPHGTVRQIIFHKRTNAVEFNFQNHENIELKMAIYDSSGNELGQSLDYLSHAINFWENEFEQCSTV